MVRACFCFFVLRCIDTVALPWHIPIKKKIIIICTLTGDGALTSDLTTAAAAEYGVPIIYVDIRIHNIIWVVYIMPNCSSSSNAQRKTTLNIHASNAKTVIVYNVRRPI